MWITIRNVMSTDMEKGRGNNSIVPSKPINNKKKQLNPLSKGENEIIPTSPKGRHATTSTTPSYKASRRLEPIVP
jgi:hypothetical protein